MQNSYQFRGGTPFPIAMYVENYLDCLLLSTGAFLGYKVCYAIENPPCKKEPDFK